MPAEPSRSARREEIREELRRKICSGELAPGSRLKEIELSRAFRTSRTPLREALLQLERDGFVHSGWARGFTVAPLSAAEAREVYPLIWTLEALAVRTSGALAAAVTPELRRLNRRFAGAKRNLQLRELDRSWHELLISQCSNRRLLAEVAALRQVIQRYESVYMENAPLVRISVRQHEQVLEAIDRGDFDGAAVALEANWRFGLESLLLKLAG